MATALANLGYGADKMVPGENRALFRAKLVTYLRGQLPVILLLTAKRKTGAGEAEVGHAVTVTGFSEPDGVDQVPPGTTDSFPALPIRATNVRVLYVHDDNLGSHAHYELEDSNECDADGNGTLHLFRGRKKHQPVDWWEPDVWTVVGALVPKPPKLRLPIESLFLDTFQLREIVNTVLPGMADNYEMRFDTGVAYKASLGSDEAGVWSEGRPPDSELADFLLDWSLPRQIAVVSVYDGACHRLDVVLDVSEIERVPGLPPILGFIGCGIPHGSPAWANLVRLNGKVQASLIAAPPST